MSIKSSHKHGFSMAEMLITIAALGMIAAIVTPSLNRFTPDKNATMFKKEYSQIERIVYELVNDRELYPEKVGVEGLQNLDMVTYNGVDYGDNSDSTSDNAKLKFACLMKSKLNTVSNSDYNCEHFKTTDGVEWYIAQGEYTDEVARIYIDTNGNDDANGPNTYPCQSSNYACLVSNPTFVTTGLSIGKFTSQIIAAGGTSTCPSEHDIYSVRIDKFGQITFNGCEAEAFKKHSIIK